MTMDNYTYLQQLPTDIKYSIFLNTPIDALDDVCQNENFTHWCQNDQAMEQYVKKLDPYLLDQPDGFIIAADKLGSSVLSQFLTDQWVTTLDPTKEYKSDFNQYFKSEPDFVKQELITFCEQANFGVLPDNNIPINDLLLIVIKYGLINRSLFHMLFKLYISRNNLKTGHERFKVDQLMLESFPGFFENEVKESKEFAAKDLTEALKNPDPIFLKLHKLITPQSLMSIPVTTLITLYYKYILKRSSKIDEPSGMIDNPKVYIHLETLSFFIKDLLDQSE